MRERIKNYRKKILFSTQKTDILRNRIPDTTAIGIK